LEAQARSSSVLALLSACALLALAGAGCGGSEKIGSLSDPTGAGTPNPTTKLSGAGGFVSVGGKGGKGRNGNGNGNGDGGGGGGNGGGHGGGNGGGGNGGGHGGGGHDHSGNGNGGGSSASFGIDSNPKTSSRAGNVAGAVDCKSNDSGGSGGSGECASTINCTNVHLPGTQGTQCCPFPIPSDGGGHKGKGSSSGGDCPTDVSGETDTSSEGSSGKSKHGHKKSSS
jgi:hypothetical protein